MSSVQEIESAITQLNPKEIHAVADWLLEYRETLWDKKIAADTRSGKLDSLIKKAKAGHRAGKATSFPQPGTVLKKRRGLIVVSTGGRKFNAAEAVSTMREERF